MSSHHKILVTGASGLLGANALHVFKALNRYEVHGVYLTHPVKTAGIACAKLDLTDTEATRAYLDQLEPRYILHTAALTNIDECERNHEAADKTNITATKNLAAWAGEAGAKLIYISTDAFFDGEGRLFTEEDKPTPLNYYSESKLKGEQVTAQLCADHLIVRTNIYGWNYQDKQSLAEWMYFSIAGKKHIPCVGDVFYSPILTQTLLECIDGLIQKDARGIYNVASDQCLSKLEFAYLLCDTFGLSREFIRPSSVKDLKLTARRSNHMGLSVEKLKRALPGRDLSVKSDLKRFKALRDSGFVDVLKGREPK